MSDYMVLRGTFGTFGVDRVKVKGILVQYSVRAVGGSRSISGRRVTYNGG